MKQGERIREARKRMGYTMNELSALTGIAQSDLSRYERSVRYAHFEHLIELAFHLEVSLYYLVKTNDYHYKILAKLERIT